MGHKWLWGDQTVVLSRYSQYTDPYGIYTYTRAVHLTQCFILYTWSTTHPRVEHFGAHHETYFSAHAQVRHHSGKAISYNGGPQTPVFPALVDISYENTPPTSGLAWELQSICAFRVFLSF